MAVLKYYITAKDNGSNVLVQSTIATLTKAVGRWYHIAHYTLMYTHTACEACGEQKIR